MAHLRISQKNMVKFGEPLSQYLKWIVRLKEKGKNVFTFLVRYSTT